MTKKASEIILELQEQVKYLTRLVANQDNNIKIIIKKLNSINASAPRPSAGPSDKVLFDEVAEIKNVAQSTANNIIQQAVYPERQGAGMKFAEGADAIALKAQHAKQQVSQFDQMKAQAGIVDEPDDILSGVARKMDDPTSMELEEATQFTGKRRGQRVDRKSAQNSKVSVSQQLLDYDGKPLALATVKVTNHLGQPVKSARSNTKGKWNAPLEPGNYEVHVLRKFASDPNKKPVEYRYTISIPISDGGRLDLPPPDLEG